jgi:parallel beta-helix repeat protein
VAGVSATLSELDISGCTGTAIAIQQDSARVENSRISCGTTGVHVDGTGVSADGLAKSSVIANNTITGQSVAGIRIAANSSDTVVDGNTLSGMAVGVRPATAVVLDGTMANLCVRNNVFAYLGDGAATGYALSVGGALTQDATFPSLCSNALDGTWNNAVFAAAGNCTGAGCNSLPCTEPAGARGSICTTTTNPDALAIREARFFDLSKVTLTKFGVADTSTDPAFVGTGDAAWCVKSPLYIDQGANLGYGRVPPYLAGESHIGAGPDIGALEAGAGVCSAYP